MSCEVRNTRPAAKYGVCIHCSLRTSRDDIIFTAQRACSVWIALPDRSYSRTCRVALVHVVYVKGYLTTMYLVSPAPPAIGGRWVYMCVHAKITPVIQMHSLRCTQYLTLRKQLKCARLCVKLYKYLSLPVFWNQYFHVLSFQLP